MANLHTIRMIVGIIGNIISLGLFFSPVPTFVSIIKQKTVAEFKPDPYLATMLQCALWMFYGMPFVKPDSALVISINSAGLVIESVYVIIFLIYCTGRKRTKILIFLLVEAIFVVVVIVAIMYTCPKPKERALVAGILCIIFNALMYAAPLTVMKMVIKTKSVKYMPFSLALLSLVNGSAWVVYALIEFDINILIPNGLGAVSGVMQLILYACFYKTTRWEDEEEDTRSRPLPPEVQMSTNV